MLGPPGNASLKKHIEPIISGANADEHLR
jgi:hypothetical protein